MSVQTKAFPLAAIASLYSRRARVISCFFLFWSFLASVLSAMPNGVVHVSEALGRVYAINQDTGERIRLKNGDYLEGALEVETGPTGQVTLNFSNGSGVMLFENSELSISEFKQLPFEFDHRAFKSITADPSSFQLHVKLIRGELLGHAKYLHPSSTFILETPALISEITGTIFGFKHTGNIDQAENELLSEVQVFEGSVVTKTKTALSANALRSLSNFESDLSPFETLIGGGQQLTSTTDARSVTLVMDNIQAQELAAFRSEIDTFAAELGIGRQAMDAALANAYGTPDSAPLVQAGMPSRITTIQSSQINTNLGPGFKITIRTQDESGYDAIEQIVGFEQKNADGSTTTTTEQIVNAYSDGEWTIYTARSDEVMQADGSYTSTASTNSTTGPALATASFGTPPTSDPNTVLDPAQAQSTHTFSSSTTANADGTLSKTANSSFTDASGTITTAETVSVALDANGKPVRTTNRTINGPSGTVIQSFQDPESSFATVSTSVSQDNSISFTSTNALGTETTISTVTFAQDGGKQITTVTTDASGTVTKSETHTVTKEPGGIFTLDPDDDDPPAHLINPDTAEAPVNISIIRLPNGGSLITETYSNGTTRTIRTDIADNGVRTETITHTDGSQTITTTENLGDGTVEITTTTIDASGTTISETTQRRNINSTDPGGGGSTPGDGDVGDGVDDAIDHIDDDIVLSN